MPIYEVKSNDLPTGIYDATFCGVEETEHKEFGAGLRWTWEITCGEHEGKIAFRTTGTRATSKTNLGKLLAMLSGSKAEEGLRVDPDQYAGHAHKIVVGESETGLARVESFHASDVPSADVPF